MGDVKKRKLHRLPWLVEIKDGVMLAPRPLELFDNVEQLETM